MKIKTTVEALSKALEIANIVKPKLRGSADTAFLIATNGGKVYVHSHDGVRYIRSELAVESIEGEGGFTFPSDKIGSLKYVAGWIELESGQDEKRHWLKYTTEGGAKVDLSTYDPTNFTTLVRKFSEATEERTFHTAILRDALKSIAAFTPSEAVKTDEHLNTLQIFDTSRPEWEKGDGIMFGADGTRAAYYSCEALKGKGLGVHIENLNYLNNFLGKCGSEVKVRFGEGSNFLIELIPDENGALTEGAVIGWASHVKEHSRFQYYATSQDKSVLMVSKELILKSLKHMRAVLSTDQDKIRLIYKDGFLHFKAIDGSDDITSAPVGVDSLKLEDGSDSIPSFEFNVNVDHFISLFESAKGYAVELRTALVPASKTRPKEAAFFRTFDRFNLNADGEVVISPEGSYECLVTRFMPSKQG